LWGNQLPPELHDCYQMLEKGVPEIVVSSSDLTKSSIFGLPFSYVEKSSESAQIILRVAASLANVSVGIPKSLGEPGGKAPSDYHHYIHSFDQDSRDETDTSEVVLELPKTQVHGIYDPFAEVTHYFLHPVVNR